MFNKKNSLDAEFAAAQNFKDDDHGLTSENSVDFLYEKRLYGKIDFAHDAIALVPHRTKLLNTAGNYTAEAIKFAADAFEDFRGYFRHSVRAGKIATASSFILDLEPSTPWKSFDDLYHAYITETVNENFIMEYLSRERRHQKIKSFKTFLDLYFEYVFTFLGKFPLTASGFMMSRYCPVSTNGLTIRINDLNLSDKNQIQAFFLDKNYSFYASSARKFGFLLDRFNPARLVADISSPVMQEHMSRYNSDYKNIFDTDYYKLYLADIDLLRFHLYYLYEWYTMEFGEVKDFYYNPCGKNINVYTIAKEPMLQDRFDNINFLYWLKLYAQIKSKELGVSWDKQRFNTFFKRAAEVNKTLDSRRALIYTNEVIKQEWKRKERGAAIMPVVEDKFDPKKIFKSMIVGPKTQVTY